MDLKDLQKKWGAYSSGDAKKRELDEKSIKKLLRNRTKGVLEKINRNIIIGFFILFVIILLFILDDLVLSPIILEGYSDELEIPRWLLCVSFTSYVFMILTFFYFVIRYNKAKKPELSLINLKEYLKKVIAILQLYKRLFLFAILIILLAIAINFITGMFYGFTLKAAELGVPVNEIQTGRILLSVCIGIVVLGIITVGLFMLARWMFRRLYGNYLTALKITLKELSEIE